ncbi:MAG: pilus assembly protein PilP [Syntrophaceae bacterium]|nr:pilus assembly protein PilP [Syntrophaceae bacterium]
MKKTKLILLNTLIIVFTSAFFSLAAEVKNVSVPTPAVSTKVVPASTNVPVVSQPPSAPAATNTPVTGQIQPVPAPNAPVVGQIPSAPAATNVPAPSATTQPAATLSSRDNYYYNPSGKPDPFLPFIKIETAKQKIEKAKKKAPLSIFPLQRAETTAYRVVGIVGNKDRRVAIAQDAAKKFYPLLVGTRIGLRNGKVAEILADRVIVEEYENNKKSRVILKLRKN